jgi:hypothetical protein
MSVLNCMRAGAVVLAALALAASLHAAEESKSPGKSSAPTASEKPRPASSPDVSVPSERGSRAADQRPRYKGRTIRCWQWGRLILEEPVVGGTKPEGPVHQLRQAGDGSGLQLLDLKDAVCLIGTPSAQ